MKEDPTMLSAVRAEVARQRREDAAALVALDVALPGPLPDAFSPVPDIKVGPHTVRPFYDLDFEFLQHLNHPFYQARQASLAGKEDEDFFPSGPAAWQLCWIMTRPPEETEKVLAAGPTLQEAVQSLTAKARSEFGRLRSEALQALVLAVARQVRVYWSTAVSYGPAERPRDKDEVAEGGAPDAPVPPPRSGAPSTASAGSSTSGAG